LLWLFYTIQYKIRHIIVFIHTISQIVEINIKFKKLGSMGLQYIV